MKTMVLQAVVTFVAMAVQAQTTSDNIVGYSKVNAVGGELSLVALNFEALYNIDDLIGNQLPANSKINMEAVRAIKNSRSGWCAGTIARWMHSGSNQQQQQEQLMRSSLGWREIIYASNVTTIASGIDLVGYSFPVETTFGNTDLANALPAGSKIHLMEAVTKQPLRTHVLLGYRS